mmetsp:Transcript_5669/g.11558  ORF Transcript_5669/g.11558 Transcript_5669/m.11558 type:complete len:133 (-) Transcript_5669:516-914(-)
MMWEADRYVKRVIETIARQLCRVRLHNAQSQVIIFKLISRANNCPEKEENKKGSNFVQFNPHHLFLTSIQNKFNTHHRHHPHYHTQLHQPSPPPSALPPKLLQYSSSPSSLNKLNFHIYRTFSITSSSVLYS